MPPDQLSFHPRSDAAAAAAGNPSGNGVRASTMDHAGDGSGGEDTGDVGDLLAELSVNESLNGVSGGGGGGSGGSGGEGGGRGEHGGAGDESEDEVMEMDKVVAKRKGGGGGGGQAMGRKERPSRRLTAEKMTVESLLGCLDSPSPTMTATEIGQAASGREEGGEASSEPRDDSGTEEEDGDSGEDGEGGGCARNAVRWDGEKSEAGQVRLRTERLETGVGLLRLGSRRNCALVRSRPS